VPVAFVFSLLGVILEKRKGFAIAGLVISSLLIALFLVGMIFAAIAMSSIPRD
jgi:hypothetical protein